MSRGQAHESPLEEWLEQASGLSWRCVGDQGGQTVRKAAKLEAAAERGGDLLEMRRDNVPRPGKRSPTDIVWKRADER